MKKFTICLILLLCSFSAKAQIDMAAYFDGYWSEWKYCISMEIRGSYAGFICYDSNDGPWEPVFSFKIDNFYMPDPKTRKRNYKSGQWYEFTGTVEYYICDAYMTAYDAFKKNKAPGFVSEAYRKKNGMPIKKVQSRAIIKIAPYKDHPKVYNIWYDNVGLGIDLKDLSF